MDGDRPEQASSSSSSSFFPVRGESSEPGSSSAPIHGGRFPSPDRFRYREIEEQRQLQQQQQQQMGDSYSRTGVRVLDDDAPSLVGEDTWSCVVVLITFWLFVSMTMVLGVYGSASLRLGPNSSFLLQPSPIFVQSIKVEETSASNPEVMLYGLYTAPSLDTLKTWSENYNVSVPTDSYKDLMYYLNKGSQIKVSYTVYSPSSSIFLVIAEGSDALAKWLENPSYPNTTLSWNVIHGSGVIWQNIHTSSSYYVAVGNLNLDDVQVELNLGIKSSMYNTSEAYYKCNVTQGSCSINILFPEGNAAVITSTDSQQNLSGHELYVKLSYGPRWATYVVGIAGMTVLMLLAFNFLNKYQCTRVETVGPHEQLRSVREPLISHKDDDLSSWGSSYDSVSNDEKDLEDLLDFEGKSFGEGENSNNTRRLCAICFDAPRDCFFLPCGHCVACFACGTRIAEADGTCPICRRKMKKVRRIFTV